MRKLVLFVGLLTTSISVQAAGRSGLAFLKIPADARSAALANAAVATACDAAVVFWNPAGLANLYQRQATLSYNRWIQDINHSAVAVALPSRHGHFSINAILTEVPGIERRETASALPLEEFSAQDFTVGFAYATKIASRISVGIQAKYLYEKIHIESADGFAVDFGLRAKAAVPGLALGAALQNLGKMDEMDKERIDLPKILRVGMHYAPKLELGGFYTEFVLDFVKIFEQDSHVHTGGQVQWADLFFLRAGYASGYEEKSWSAGLGIKWGPARLDYAYVPFSSDLGNAQQFSLTVLF
ncbi:PorV/PorQ family protein [candidate division KSB1 bacterium]|nr:PorV/PorQ family protein [candidate division KSB1 bacterium]